MIESGVRTAAGGPMARAYRLRLPPRAHGNPPCSLPGGRIQLPTLGVGPGKSCGYGRRPCSTRIRPRNAGSGWRMIQTGIRLT